MSEEELSARAHAFLFTAIAKRVIDQYGEKGKETIRDGVIHYGRQRGKRMAQRALADGQELTALNYIAYGEWKARPGEMEIEMPEISPDIRFLYKKCPWCDLWKERGLLSQYGYLYCKYVDAAIAEGFNPHIKFDVVSTRGCGASVCDMRFRGARAGQEDIEQLQQQAKELGDSKKRGWDYHCAHLYKALWEVVSAELGIKGQELLLQALQDFSREYGEKNTNAFLKLVEQDFNVAD